MMEFRRASSLLRRGKWKRANDLDETFSITFGPHLVGRYSAEAVEMTPPRKATKAVASRRGLEKSGQKAAWLSHIPTATTA